VPESEYMTFCCNDPEHPCDYRFQGKTREEVMENARTHMEKEHGKTGRDVDERIRDAIKLEK
jgi:predicted small metal-binding protein